MVTRMIFLAIMLAALNFSAQQLSTSGQSNLKFYKKSIERLEKMKPGSMGYDEAVLDAEKKIASIKKTDPGYDVSLMEEEVKKYKQLDQTSKQNQEKDITSGKEIEKELNTYLSWNLEDLKNAKTQAEYDQMDKRVNDQIVSLSGFCKDKLASIGQEFQGRIENYWEVTGPDHTQLNSSKNYYQKSEERTVFSYYQAKWLYNKWKLFSEMYPKSGSLAAAFQKADEVLKMIGSAEEAKKHGENAKAQRLADTKMEPSVVNDPDLEAQIKKAVLNSKFATGKTIVKINIHSKNWAIQKHAVTGITLSRTKSYSAGLKDKDGKCYLLHYSDFKQDYVGGNFGEGYINLGELVEILCQNIK